MDVLQSNVGATQGHLMVKKTFPIDGVFLIKHLIDKI